VTLDLSVNRKGGTVLEINLLLYLPFNRKWLAWIQKENENQQFNNIAMGKGVAGVKQKLYLFFFACNKQSYLKLESKQQSYLFQRIGPTPRFLSSF
jgi:hypothetical protein